MNQTSINLTTTTLISSPPQPGLKLDYNSIINLIELAFGMLTNLINIIVFCNPRLKDTAYIYMLATSCANFAYQFFLFINSVADFCQSYCLATYQTYFIALYFNIVSNYLLTSLAFFRTQVDVLLSLHTYCILTNRNWLRRISWKWILPLFFLIALLIYLDKPLSTTIVTYYSVSRGMVVYSPWYSTAALTNPAIFNTIAVLNTSLRVFLIIVVLTVINTVNVLEFRKRYLRRHRIGIFLQVQTLNNLGNNESTVNTLAPPNTVNALSNMMANKSSIKENKKSNSAGHKKATRNITRMAILTSFLNVVGTCPYTLLYIIVNANSSIYASIPGDIINISFILLFGYPGFNIFIYVFYNKLYRDVLVGYLKKTIQLFYFGSK